MCQNMHFQIEPHHRMIWHKIDLNAYFEQEMEQIERISRTHVNLNLLSRDLDLTKVEKDSDIDRDNKYSDEVGL